MAETLTIEHRFRGPPESGNGGYSCGLVASAIDAAAAEVTLRMPPPLERELTLQDVDGGVELRDGDSLVAEGRPLHGLEVDIPEPVGLEEAAAAREASPLHDHHAWPMCFVCGPDRSLGDGMRVTCGPVDGRELVASPWETSSALPHDGEALSREMVWSALDCPGGIAAMLLAEQPLVTALGRLSARIDSLPRPGEAYVAIGWPIERDGRKHHTGSAVLTADGQVLASARATWIELQGDMLGART